MSVVEKVKSVALAGAFQLRKHSPAIFIGLGVVGMGATAYMAYKARPKVEKIVEEMEWADQLGQPMPKSEVIKGVATAVAPAVMLGVASGACFVLAHQIQNRRVKALAGSLSSLAAERFLLRRKSVETHGEEETNRIFQPTREELKPVVDKDGLETTSSEPVAISLPGNLSGVWYKGSEHYVEDSYAYNMRSATNGIEACRLALFSRGWILMNEVFYNLGLPRTKQGALMGWSIANEPDFEVQSATRYDEDGKLSVTDVFIAWNPPTFVYDQMEFKNVFE